MKAKELKNQGLIIKLKGKEVEIKLNMNVFSELEDLYSNPMEIISALSQGSFKAIRALIWANMKMKNSKITVEEVGEMIEFNDITTICETIIKVIDMSIPEVDEESDSENLGE